MNSKISNNLIERLQSKVFERRPILREIISEFGNMSLFDYVKRYYRSPEYPVSDDRKREFLEAFQEEVESVYGSVTAKSCAKQVGISFHLTDSEHFTPIGITEQTNNILTTLLPVLDSNLLDHFPYNIQTVCSKISFNNSSFPRGFEFHTYVNKGLRNNQLLFFSHKVDKKSVFNHSGYGLENLDEMRKSLERLWADRSIWKREYNAANSIINEIFARDDILSEKLYTNQVAKINFSVWKKIGEKLGNRNQDLIYVEQERLVNRILLKYHLNKTTKITQLIFDKNHLDLISKYFDGIMCGFSEKTNHGTFLFWGLPKNGNGRVQLWRRDNRLVSSDGSFEIKLHPEVISNAILHGEIIPSTLLSFIIFSFYYQLRQIGGFSQTTYLTQMKEAYISLLRETGDFESVALTEQIPTKDFIIINNDPLFTYMQGPKNELISATPLDLYLYGDHDTLDIVKKISKNITLGESFLRSLPSVYRFTYLESEREEELVKIDDKYINKVIGFDKKIIPFARIGQNVKMD